MSRYATLPHYARPLIARALTEARTYYSNARHHPDRALYWRYCARDAQDRARLLFELADNPEYWEVTA